MEIIKKKGLKYYLVNCYWCNRDLEQRIDTYKRQIEKYNHSCCKKCFGKEPSFKEARRLEMINNNPFKGKFHNSQTKQLLSEKKIGKTAWNKGKGKYQKRKLNISLWRTCRDNVINRDYFTCCKCNEEFDKKHLHVHHLNSRTRYAELQYNEFNCVTLCISCHREFHKLYGIKIFTPQDFKDFINKNREVENYFKFS